MFEVKNFEDLHKDKIKNSAIVPVHCKYFFSFDNNFMFIKKSKKFYQLCASCQCGFEPAFRQSTFDILYYNENLDLVIDMFRSYVDRLLCRVYPL